MYTIIKSDLHKNTVPSTVLYPNIIWIWEWIIKPRILSGSMIFTQNFTIRDSVLYATEMASIAPQLILVEPVLYWPQNLATGFPTCMNIELK